MTWWRVEVGVDGTVESVAPVNERRNQRRCVVVQARNASAAVARARKIARSTDVGEPLQAAVTVPEQHLHLLEEVHRDLLTADSVHAFRGKLERRIAALRVPRRGAA